MLILWEECRLRVFENRVLRTMYGSKRYEVIWEWRKLHYEEFSDVYYSPNIIQVIKSRRVRWAQHVTHMGERRGVYRILVGKPDGNRPLGRPRRIWENNIKISRQWDVGYGLDRAGSE